MEYEYFGNNIFREFLKIFPKDNNLPAIGQEIMTCSDVCEIDFFHNLACLPGLAQIFAATKSRSGRPSPPREVKVQQERRKLSFSEDVDSQVRILFL